MSHKAAVLLILAAFVAIACDPAGSVVIDNQSPGGYVARVSRFSDLPDDWYIIPTHSRRRIASNAVGNDLPTKRVRLLDLSCVSVFDQDFQNIKFPGGGVITVDANGDVSFQSGNPEVPPAADTTEICAPEATPTPE